MPSFMFLDSIIYKLVDCAIRAVFFKLFGPRPPFAVEHFKGPSEEWVSVEKHPGVEGLI